MLRMEGIKPTQSQIRMALKVGIRFGELLVDVRLVRYLVRHQYIQEEP